VFPRRGSGNRRSGLRGGWSLPARRRIGMWIAGTAIALTGVLPGLMGAQMVPSVGQVRDGPDAGLPKSADLRDLVSPDGTSGAIRPGKTPVSADRGPRSTSRSVSSPAATSPPRRPTSAVPEPRRGEHVVVDESGSSAAPRSRVWWRARCRRPATSALLSAPTAFISTDNGANFAPLSGGIGLLDRLHQVRS